jgi:uncharacterized hydrophobic protein (TIGR00271 family)
MLRVRVVSPPHRTDSLVAALLPVPGVVTLAVDRGTSVKPPGDVVVADVIRECANEVLAHVEALGLDAGEITLTDISADRSELADDARDEYPGRGVDVVVWDEFEQRVRVDGEPSIAFFSFMAIAAVIATVGIVVDSSVLIVGAMVVGPEYGPLAALAVSLYKRRGRPALDALATLVGGLLLAIVVSTIATTVFEAIDTGIVSVNERFFTKFVTEPNIYSAIVAFAAGLVGIMAIGLGRSGALTGVVVSATTIPAAAAIGVDASNREWDSAGRGALVLLINVLCLVAGSIIALVAQRYLWAHVARIPVGIRGRDLRHMS